MACALVDSGASQSFVYATFVRLCDLPTELLPAKVLVRIPNGSTVSCTRVVRDYPLEVEALVLKADLIVFHLMEFDLILSVI